MARTPGAAAIAPRRRREPPVWTFGALRIRRYAAADHAAVYALHRECMEQVGVRPGDGVYYDDDFARIEEIYLCRAGEFLVGEIDGEITAIGALRRIDDTTAEMVRLRVHPDQQGLGYGAAMVAILEERAAELGYRLLRADTTVKQSVAIELYRTSGWREIERKVTGNTVTVYFDKWLCSAHRAERPPDRQPQQPPPQQPLDGGGDGAEAMPPTATVDSSLTVSSCPAGQVAGAEASLIGRDTSNVDPQARQR